MKAHTFFLCALLAGLAPILAQSTSTSASYTLLHAPAGDLAGGGRVANASAIVTADISVGDPGSGVVTAGGVQAKGNLIGQLTDPRAFGIAVTPSAVNEGGTSQLSGVAMLDDATTLAVAGTQVAWSVGFGPVASLTASGLITTSPVLGPTSAQLRGSYLGLADPDGTLLNVIDTGESDAFAQYAGDGIDDGWQFAHFGQPPNASAAPTADPDGDGRNNRLEFLSGFTPTNPASAFQFTITGFSSANVMNFRLNKVIPGRTYTLKESPNLTSPFTPVGSFSVPSEETNKLVQDTTAPGNANFYRIEIAKP